jgi:hypothetical protein
MLLIRRLLSKLGLSRYSVPRKNQRKRHHRQHPHHGHVRVFLVVNGYWYELSAHKRTIIMEQLTVGHTDTMSIIYLDTTGNPMLVPVTPDSPPSWTNTPATPPVDTFTVAPGGAGAVLAATAAGSDTVTLSVTVGGKVYTATQAITISAAPQVLGSVAIQNAVQ